MGVRAAEGLAVVRDVGPLATDRAACFGFGRLALMRLTLLSLPSALPYPQRFFRTPQKPVAIALSPVRSILCALLVCSKPQYSHATLSTPTVNYCRSR
jgi:hypothetical protein